MKFSSRSTFRLPAYLAATFCCAALVSWYFSDTHHGPTWPVASHGPRGLPVLNPSISAVTPRGNFAESLEDERRAVLTRLMRNYEETPYLRNNFDAYNQVSARLL